MIRIGIVGAGFIGVVHSAALEQLVKHRLVDARVVAVHDTDPERADALAKPHEAEAAPTVDDLLDRVDAVWVCTWTAMHRALVEQAAARGLAIFCEKPLAPSWDDACAVADALAAVPNQVGLVLRSSPVFIALAERVRARRDGAHLTTLLRDDQYFPVQGIYASTWRGDRTLAGGGTLIEHSIHDVDLLRWFLGDPVRVSATVTDRTHHAGIDDTATATFTYADGTSAVLVSVWHDVMTRVSTRRLEVFCADALCWTDDDTVGPLRVETSDGTEVVPGGYPGWTAALDGPDDYRDAISGYAVANHRFLAALAAGEPGPGPGAAVALAAHRLVEAAYRSARAGGVPVDPATI